MKYQVTAVKDNMRVRFVLNAIDLRSAIDASRAYIKDQTDIDAAMLDQFDVFQIDKEADKTPVDAPGQTHVPGTSPADLDPEGKGNPRPLLTDATKT